MPPGLPRATCLGFLALALGAGPLGAQAPVRIFGFTREAGTARPIEGVEILVAGVTRSVFSNAAGAFVFDSLPPGRVAVTARLPGYQAARAQFVIDPGVSLEVDLQLTPLDQDLPQVLPEVNVRGQRIRGLHGVVSGPSSRPVVGALVRVYGGGASERSDSLGRFAFPGLKAGPYLVAAEYEGLTGKPLHVTVPSGGYREVVLRLGLPGLRTTAVPGQRWVYHDLGLRLSFQPNSTRMTREELVRFSGRQLCDIARIRSVLVDDTPRIIVDGLTVLEEWPLCGWGADELDLVEWGSCVSASQPLAPLSMNARTGGPMQRSVRSGRRNCIMVWTR